MEKNPECCICVHQAMQEDCVYNKKTLVSPYMEDLDVPVGDIIRGGGGIFATNSVLVKKEIYENIPSCFTIRGVGDYQLFMYGAITGTCHYINRVMSQYNFGTEGSWTIRISRNTEKRINLNKKIIEMLKKVNVFYNYIYDNDIKYKILELEYANHRLKGNFFSVIRYKYHSFYKMSVEKGEYPFKESVVIRFPILLSIKKLLKKGNLNE